jgi:hypothetical protein
MEQKQNEGCLVCDKQNPDKEWVDDIYEAEKRRFCSLHCQARFETEPEQYVGPTQGLVRPQGYS